MVLCHRPVRVSDMSGMPTCDRAHHSTIVNLPCRGACRQCQLCRAIGEYAATEDLSPSEASSLVDTVFRRLQDLDYVFFHAQKIGQQPDLNQAEAKLADASGAINKCVSGGSGFALPKTAQHVASTMAASPSMTGLPGCQVVECMQGCRCLW